MSETDLLDRIDEVAADVCHQCGRALGASVSPWFCGQDCQAAWTAHQHDVQELVSYREAMGHATGWCEDSARWRPEGQRRGSWPDTAALWESMSEADREELRQRFAEVGQRVSAMADAMTTAWTEVAKQVAETLRRAGYVAPPRTLPAEDPAVRALRVAPPRTLPAEDPAVRALRLRQQRNTGPQVHADPRRNRRGC